MARRNSKAASFPLAKRAAIGTQRKSAMETMSATHSRLAMFLNASRMGKMCHLFTSLARPGAVRGTFGRLEASLLRQYSDNSLPPVKKRRPTDSWTAEEDRKLMELRAQGMKLMDVAREMKTRTYLSIIEHVKTLDGGCSPKRRRSSNVESRRGCITGGEETTGSEPF